jgi:hypothetical protein
MLLLVLPFFTSSLNNKFPIERYSCSANINGSFYSLNTWSSRPAESFFDSATGLLYYAKMCGGLDGPDYFPQHSQYAIAVCNSTAQVCYPIASRWAQDYRFINENNPSAGIVISFMGEPVPELPSIQSWLTYFYVNCDPGQTSTTISLAARSETVRTSHRVIFQFGSNGGCPRIIPAPTPTPFYSPRCDFASRRYPPSRQGILLDLDGLNGGPFGHFFHIRIDDQPRTIFYQPCERSNCPATVCDTNVTFSSLWLCDENVTACVSYVSPDSPMSMSEARPGESRAVDIGWVQRGRWASVQLRCDASGFNNHLTLLNASLDANELRLSLIFGSRDVCPQSVLEPESPDPRQFFIDATDRAGLHVEFDARVLSVDPGPVQIMLAGVEFPFTRDLYYAPARGIACPFPGCCHQYEDAYMWICDDKPDCVPYGLFSEPTVIEPVTDTLNDGVQIVYKGGEGHAAIVEFQCNPSLQSGVPQVPQRAVLDFETRLNVSLTVPPFGTSDVCPVQTPGPTPALFNPPRPMTGQTVATPRPEFDPYLFLDLGAEYILIDLKNMNAQSHETALLMMNDRQTIQYRVFQQSKCPEGYDCGPYGQATWWGCWQTVDASKYCYPIAEATFGTAMSLLDQSDPDMGVLISFAGHNSIGTQLSLYCDPNVPETTYFPLDSIGSYYSALTHADYSFTGSSEMSCPASFLKATVPSFTATPTPAPVAAFDPKLFRETYGSEETAFTIDLTRYETASQSVVVGVDRFYEKIVIVFSPVHPIGCPAGYDCSDFGDTNVWKCWSDPAKTCFPIGDARYEFRREPIDSADLSKGIQVLYGGGLGGSSVHFRFYCNLSISEEQMVFDPVGERIYPSEAIHIDVQTNQTCPGHIILFRDPMTVGAIGIVAFNGLVILYIMIGMIVASIRFHYLEFPNLGFWAEVWLSFGYPFGCRHAGIRGHSPSQSCEMIRPNPSI